MRVGMGYTRTDMFADRMSRLEAKLNDMLPGGKLKPGLHVRMDLRINTRMDVCVDMCICSCGLVRVCTRTRASRNTHTSH